MVTVVVWLEVGDRHTTLFKKDLISIKPQYVNVAGTCRTIAIDQ